MRLTVLARPNLEEMIQAIADAIARVLGEALQQRGRASLFLSGGSTPAPVYERLAQVHGAALPWDRITLFWGDERWVKPDDPLSNQRMAREKLIDRIAIPAGNVFPIPTEGTPADAADRYDDLLRDRFPERGPGPDLVLLGLGQEGHTASLFPGSPALQETVRWTTAVTVEATPPRRLTVTYPLLDRADQIFFLAAGRKKAQIVRKIFIEGPPLVECPAAGVRPARGGLSWWLDEEAASQLPPFFQIAIGKV